MGCFSDLSGTVAGFVHFLLTCAPLMTSSHIRRYRFADADGIKHIFEEGPSCAQDLLESDATKRDTGMRPVPSVGQVGE